ncbi:hypothetical protein [Leptospira noguchii]|nr:hypothetical protein [Leptospira noguchii]
MSLKNSEGIEAKRTQRLAMVARSKLSVSLPMGRSTGREPF